jgi:RNA polymerase sigma factor (sigma-70 family)
MGDSEDGIANFSAFYEDHAERILVYLTKRCLDPEVAVELMAATFARAFVKRRSYRGRSDAEASAWVFAIARRQLLDYFRRGRAERKAVRRLGLSIPPLGEDDHARIEELADLGPMRKAVADGFAKLSGEQREAVRLRVVEEMSYAEVAKRLRISEDTARARVSRGLRRLGTLFDQPTLAREGAKQ